MNTETTAGAGPVDQRVKPLTWTGTKEPDQFCPYHHCIAETPFGRFLITWKGWKDDPCPTVDETPWNEWFGSFVTVAEAQQACAQEFNRRLALCFAA